MTPVIVKHEIEAAEGKVDITGLGAVRWVRQVESSYPDGPKSADKEFRIAMLPKRALSKATFGVFDTHCLGTEFERYCAAITYEKESGLREDLG